MGYTQRKLDGFPVEEFSARFGGNFEMDEDTGNGVAYDDVMCFLVTATAGKVSFDSNKDGELKRTNTFVIDSVHIVPPELAVKIANNQNVIVDGVNGGQLSLTDPVDVTATFDDDDEDWSDWNHGAANSVGNVVDNPDVDPLQNFLNEDLHV